MIKSKRSHSLKKLSMLSKEYALTSHRFLSWSMKDSLSMISTPSWPFYVAGSIVMTSSGKTFANAYILPTCRQDSKKYWKYFLWGNPTRWVSFSNWQITVQTTRKKRSCGRKKCIWANSSMNLGICAKYAFTSSGRETMRPLCYPLRQFWTSCSWKAATTCWECSTLSMRSECAPSRIYCEISSQVQKRPLQSSSNTWT